MREDLADAEARHKKELEKREVILAEEVRRLERKREDMKELMEAEIANYLKTIERRDERIAVMASTIKKSLSMMKYPRLMQLILREIHFDRFEYTWEEKLEIAKELVERDFH